MTRKRKGISSPKGLLLLLFAINICIVWLLGFYEVSRIPSIIALKFFNPPYSAYMVLYKIRHPTQKILYTWVDNDKIASHLKNAVVSREDDLFFEHDGLDWKSIQRAVKYNIRKKRFARGASTITQQLARNLYLSPFKTISRKMHELALALIMEKILSKERILELYLNVVEWGPGIFGAEAAARYYFKSSAARLGPDESAFLASILPKPKRYANKRSARISKKAK